MFIQTEITPNPATLKFLPGRVVLPNGTASFKDVEIARERSSLAVKLFSISGISGVFFGYDFITITKNAGAWEHLKPAILGVIMEHMMSDIPVMLALQNEEEQQEFFDPADNKTVCAIKELIESRVRPAVAQDGGDITFCGFEKGIVYLNMRGACANCPSSVATLKHGIENLLRHFIPEIQGVEAMPQ
ncbi:MAG: Thioredoxin-like protein [Candidatus Tokpelaia sp. JSC188]|nr:MAG: Thioredoxin-like protein [Candidatus Tokpelaia sp. JSC188]